jgi:hypothetical protein
MPNSQQEFPISNNRYSTIYWAGNESGFETPFAENGGTVRAKCREAAQTTRWHWPSPGITVHNGVRRARVSEWPASAGGPWALMMPAAKHGARLILGSGDLLSKDPRRGQRDDQADWKNFRERHGYVDRRIGVHLLELFCLALRLVHFLLGRPGGIVWMDD